MKYELGTIETLTEKHLRPKQEGKKQFEPIDLKTFKLEFKAETERIKRAFLNTVLGCGKEKHAQRYIQLHQSSLILLCNRIMGHVPLAHNKEMGLAKGIVKISSPCFIALTGLEKLLGFIGNRFPEYFNKDEEVPVHSQLDNQKWFLEGMDDTPGNSICKLKRIALYPINSFVQERTPITYRRLEYLKVLNKEVKRACTQCKGDISNNQICKLNCSLVYINFNSFKFFNHTTNLIKSEYTKHKSPAKQADFLAYYLKKLNQVHEKPNVGYKNNYPSIKTQLTEWILLEMSFLKGISPKPAKPGEFPVKEGLSKFKVKTNYSVPQLALLALLQKKKGLINNENVGELFEFFAENFETKGAVSMSAKSFRKKYYNPDESTIKSMQGIFIELINELQKGI